MHALEHPGDRAAVEAGSAPLPGQDDFNGGTVTIGALLFSAVLLFQIVTLPVEFDATARAKKLVVAYGIISERERGGMDRVLNAAALTYVAAVVSTLLTLLYFLMRAGFLGGRGRLAVRARFRSLRQTPVEHSDSLPEHGRRRAFPRLPLVDDGFPRRAHQGGQLRLAQPARATQRANLRIVVAWHAGPGQWRATIIWANRVAHSTTAETPWQRRSRASPEPAKGGPGVIGHRQPPVPRRRPQRLDVHADEQREHG